MAYGWGWGRAAVRLGASVGCRLKCETATWKGADCGAPPVAKMWSPKVVQEIAKSVHLFARLTDCRKYAAQQKRPHTETKKTQNKPYRLLQVYSVNLSAL